MIRVKQRFSLVPLASVRDLSSLPFSCYFCTFLLSLSFYPARILFLFRFVLFVLLCATCIQLARLFLLTRELIRSWFLLYNILDGIIHKRRRYWYYRVINKYRESLHFMTLYCLKKEISFNHLINLYYTFQMRAWLSFAIKPWGKIKLVLNLTNKSFNGNSQLQSRKLLEWSRIYTHIESYTVQVILTLSPFPVDFTTPLGFACRARKMSRKRSRCVTLCSIRR